MKGKGALRALCIVAVIVAGLIRSAAAGGHHSGKAYAVQAQILSVGILSFQDETGENQIPDLSRKIAQGLQQKLLAVSKDVLPRVIGPNDSGGALTVEQMTALGKQYGVAYVVRGGVLALTTDDSGGVMKATVQLYATIVAVEDSGTRNLRAEGAGIQKASGADSGRPGSPNSSGAEGKRVAIELALANASENLAAAIHQTLIGRSPDASSSTTQSQNSADVKNADSSQAGADDAKAADADAELQQLVGQAEQMLSSGSASTEHLKSLGDALAGLKAALGQKANLLEQGKQAEAAQTDTDIATRKEALQAAVAKITEEASANSLSPTPTPPDASQANSERKSVVATISEILNESLTLIQKIQEMRAASRAANPAPPVGSADPQTSGGQQTDTFTSGQQLPSQNPNLQKGDPTGSRPDAANGALPVPAEEVNGVVTEDGKPVEGATVTETTSGVTATTAMDGSYTLAGVIGGRLAQLVVSKAGRQIASGHVDVLRGRPGIADFQAKTAMTKASVPVLKIIPSVVAVLPNGTGKTGVIKGTVGDAQEKPAPRALVSLQGLAVARTDSNGQYMFINVPEGTYQVTVRQAGMKPRSQSVQVAPANAVSARTQFMTGDKINKPEIAILKPGAGSAVRGKIVDDQNRGVGGARVFLNHSAGAVSAMTKDDGSYEVRQLKPGSYRLLASKPGYEDASLSLSLREGETGQGNLRLKKKESQLAVPLPVNPPAAPGEIIGQIRSANGSAVANATVEIREGGKTAPLARTVTDARGEFRLKVQAGKYELKVSQKSFADASLIVNVRAGGPTRQDVLLKGETSVADSRRSTLTPNSGRVPGTIPSVKNGQVSGRVTDARSGVPIAGAVVSIAGTGSATTDREGKYVIPNLPPGSYQAIVKRSGFADGQRGLSLRAGESSTLDFKLTAKPSTLKP